MTDRTEPDMACALCGAALREASARALGWSWEPHDHGGQWLCPDCARRHLRSIEARLDRDWW